MLTFTGKRAKPAFVPTKKRNKKAHIKLEQSELTAAIVIHNDDPSSYPGDRLVELKFDCAGIESKHWMMEQDARDLGEWLLKVTKEKTY